MLFRFHDHGRQFKIWKPFVSVLMVYHLSTFWFPFTEKQPPRTRSSKLLYNVSQPLIPCPGVTSSHPTSLMLLCFSESNKHIADWFPPPTYPQGRRVWLSTENIPPRSATVSGPPAPVCLFCHAQLSFMDPCIWIGHLQTALDLDCQLCSPACPALHNHTPEPPPNHFQLLSTFTLFH